MRHADGEGCAFSFTHPPAHTNCTRAHMCTETQITHTNCAVILWAVTALDDGSFFLPLSASPFISRSKTNASIHHWPPSSPSSTLSLSQPTCNKSSTLVSVKWKSTSANAVWTSCVYVHACGMVGGGKLKEREIHPVPFPLSPHYKTQGFSEYADEPQRVFHLKMELMPWHRLQITLQILITAAWQPHLNQWTLACWTSSHSWLVSGCSKVWCVQEKQKTQQANNAPV